MKANNGTNTIIKIIVYSNLFNILLIKIQGKQKIKINRKLVTKLPKYFVIIIVSLKLEIINAKVTHGKPENNLDKINSNEIKIIGTKINAGIFLKKVIIIKKFTANKIARKKINKNEK